jgi:branched-chain amino acid transport system substrate-binding protein
MTKTVKAAALSAVAALLLAACGGSSGGGNTLVISTDLPLQGANKDGNDEVNNGIALYLEQVGGKVTSADGTEYTVELKYYDNATAAKGTWDDAQCAKNAQDHVANANEIAVLGTYNSGCAKIEVPVLNQDPNGPMLMISMANTNPGLTKPWEPGEPDKYYPTGKRNYGRTIATDDFQGMAGAQFMAQKIGVKKCLVLNDNSTYGQGVAKAFADNAVKQGITVIDNVAYDMKQPSYQAIFEKYKSQSPDCVYFGATFDSNGGQLVKDKVAVLGDNTKVKLLAPDGYVGYPDFDKMPEAAGAYLSFAGLSADTLIAQGGKGAEFANSFKDKYGKLPQNSYTLYGVAALQVVLAGIAASDGTRAGLTSAVLGGSGVTISAADSVLGKEIHLDPKTGDTVALDVTIMQETDGAPKTLMPWAIQF